MHEFERNEYELKQAEILRKWDMEIKEILHVRKGSTFFFNQASKSTIRKTNKMTNFETGHPLGRITQGLVNVRNGQLPLCFPFIPSV